MTLKKKLSPYNFRSRSKLKFEQSVRFVVELVQQLRARLPKNFETLEKINVFSVDRILRAQKEKIEDFLEQLNVENISDILTQYGKIHLFYWENKEDTVKFWAEVLSFRDSSDNNPFKSLALFAIRLLCLPWSNAEVERVFSQNEHSKSNLRNRYGLRRNGKCCHDYEVPTKF
ncbi:uncharacterized protein LOC127566364 [Drosophila albomicans]|uniref:Uncharacterized protein LOC127566364 n=1 Tax=Drosophila albomicans TaxID=7291 RepID=A0A9C6SYZ7_DROAB|nr:uncharacterized protein LOC127566364 [Drosophila albomicans]